MKDSLTKIFSSGLKYVVGLAVAFLVSQGIFTADFAASLDAELTIAIVAFAGSAATIATAIGQMLIKKYFPAMGKKDGGQSGGIAPLLLMIGGAVGLMGFLPSCGSDYPITGSLIYREPNTGAKAVIAIGRRKVPATPAPAPEVIPAK